MNKTKKSKTVAINNIFAKELIAITKHNGLTNGCLFIGSIKSDKAFYSRKFKIMKDELNLNPDYVLYLIRHTAGTLALEKSKNIHLVKTLLGHKSIKTTDQYYMLENPEALRDVQDELVNKVYNKS